MLIPPPGELRRRRYRLRVAAANGDAAAIVMLEWMEAELREVGHPMVHPLEPAVERPVVDNFWTAA